MKTMDMLVRRFGRALSHALAVCALSFCVLAQPTQAGETITFFHNDNAGSPMLATDVNANLVWKETYRPYGDRLIDASTSDNNAVWFTGKPYDEQTGLSYFGARYYDPTIGRFMGIDPAPVYEKNIHSPNRYAYANNNPYKYVDPDGRVPLIVLVPIVLKGIDMAITAYDVHQAYKEGGVKGAAIEVGTNAAMNAVPGLKSGRTAIKAVMSRADVVGDTARRLPDSALVCRGGTCQADNFRNGSGVTEHADGTLSGVSTQSKAGASLEELSQPFQNNQVGVTTAGDIRAAGGEIVADGTPGNPNHATVNGLSAEKLQELFTPTEKNPVPPPLRGR